MEKNTLNYLGKHRQHLVTFIGSLLRSVHCASKHRHCCCFLIVGKILSTFRGFFFSRFYWNDWKITVPFAFSRHYSGLLTAVSVGMKWKLNPFQVFSNGAHILLDENFYRSIWRNILTGKCSWF